MIDLIVIGAGASGLMGAYAAASSGLHVLLLEKNPKVGRKIGISGKGRCNLTNNCDEKTFIDHVITNPRFLYTAIHLLPPSKLMGLVEDHGTKLKTERGDRVFPVSDRSFDVIDALLDMVKKSGAKLRCNTTVQHVEKTDNGFLVDIGREKLFARCVLLSTGGMSYPATGSTGDGYRFAKAFSLEVNEPLPALIPLVSDDPMCRDLMGLSLKNVVLTVSDGSGKKIYRELGEMLFTHFGISGPLVLSASSYVQAYLRKHQLTFETAKIKACVDLKPALDAEMLDKRILRDFEKYHLKELTGAMNDLVPHRLIPKLIALSGLDPRKRADQITKEERMRLGRTMKNLVIPIKGSRPLEEAIVTNGGIAVKQFSPGNMMAKNVPGLFAAGELLDIDALTGGFNLQSAFATGYAAGLGAADFLQNRSE
ncbi:MAG: NAD(P)/FAD-dependent oxidoreductase [Firmicutes bacterium]|nr:NAD(P)/FAD-dependent oxidoreductase [Bacillota bacterium]